MWLRYRLPLCLSIYTLLTTNPARTFVLNRCKLEIAVFKQFNLVDAVLVFLNQARSECFLLEVLRSLEPKVSFHLRPVLDHIKILRTMLGSVLKV